MEQFEFPVEVVYPPTLDSDGLLRRFDVLVFVDGAIPRRDTEDRDRYRMFSPPEPEDVPAEYRDRLGSISIDKTIPRLLRFLQEGGTILALGSSTTLVEHAGLLIKNALVEMLPDGTERPLSREQILIPGSLLCLQVDNSHPLAYGMPEKADVVFNNSPVFQLQPEAILK